MKLKVEEVFLDKYDSSKVYTPGELIDISEDTRAKSLMERGLCSAVGGNDNGEEKAPVVENPAEQPEKTGKKNGEEKAPVVENPAEQPEKTGKKKTEAKEEK